MGGLKVVKRSRVAFPLAFVSVLAMVFISEGAYWHSVETLQKIGATETARTRIQELQRSLVQAEAGQLGYLLTGRKEALQPYDKALHEIDQTFQFLNRYYDMQARPTNVLADFHALTNAKLSEFAMTIRLHDEGKGTAATALVLGAISKAKMDAIWTRSAELLEHETLNVAESRADIYYTLMLRRLGMAVFSAFSLLALFMYLRQTFALNTQRQELQRVVQVERDRLEIEVSQRTAQLTELTHHLQTAREDERHRLARNLHDDLGSLLTSAKLDAARIKSRLGGTAPAALELLTHLVGTLNSSIALGRRIIEDLRPSALSNLGLVATLEILTREFAEQSGVEVHCALEPVRLEATAELMVYRLVQEAITNITKYAKANHVWVSLGTRAGQVEVAVRDDGVGFDTIAKPNSAYGLVGMRFRVEAEGGSLALVSAPGRGTLIRANLPESTRGTAAELGPR